MRNNDLSNFTAPVIAFNVDNLLFKSEEEGKMRKLFNKIRTDKSIYLSRDLNHAMCCLVNNIWHKHNSNIYLVTFKQFDEDIDDILREQDIYFTKVVFISSIEELIVKVQNNYTYYFDNDSSILSRISLRNALHVDDISKVL